MQRQAALVLTSLFLGAALAQPVVLHTLAQEGSAPKFLDADPATGHCPDILAAINQVDNTLQVQIGAQPAPVKRLENELRAGRIDLVCALLDTPARNEIAHRVEPPIYYVQERLVGRLEDTVPITSLADLARLGELVVTQSGASYAADLRSAGVRVAETPGASVMALRQVEARRARYYYTNALTGSYYIRAEGMAGQLRLHPGILKSSPSYLWVSRHLDAATVHKLERAVKTLQHKGELDRIYKRYASE